MLEKLTRVFLAAVVTVGLSAPLASADDKKPITSKVVFVDGDRRVVTTYWDTTYGHDGCPAGYDRRDNMCWRKGVTKRSYLVGSPLASTVVYEDVPSVLYTQMSPPPAGYRYVMVDGDVLLMNTATRLIADAIVRAFR